MKITRKSVSALQGGLAKRFHVPYLVEMPCPECGTLATVDLENEHLSYPSFGKPCKVYFGCECEEEWQVNVVIDVTLTSA